MNNSAPIKNVLIVEDNPGDLILIASYLSEEFSQPTIINAKTFSEATIKLAENTKFDVILLDLSLPDASGNDLVNDMVQLAGATPIIVLTGYLEKNFGIKTLGLGISDYLLKDELTAGQLYKSIAYSVERSRISNNLKNSEEEYRNLFSLSPIPMWVYDVESIAFLKVNEAAVKHYGYSEAEFLTMRFYDLNPGKNNIDFKKKMANLLNIEGKIKMTCQHLKKDGELIDVEIQQSEIDFDDKKARLVLSDDITVRVFNKNILAFEKEVYELNAKAGVSFNEVLDTLTKTFEAIMPGSSCSILQKEGNKVRNLAAGSMPKSFLAETDGMDISATDGCCGPSMFTGLITIVADIDNNPLWKNYGSKVQPYGFKACWSVPIKKSDGVIVGSFAIFFKKIYAPLPHHLRLLERAASLIGILIENRNAADNIRISNERYDIVAKATSEIIWDWNITKDTMFWNKGITEILGYVVLNDMTDEDWWGQRIHPDDSIRVLDKIKMHIDNKILKWTDEYRFLCGDNTYKHIYDRGFLILDTGGNGVRMIGAMQDFTKQKEEEHQLKLLESVITNTNDSVLITESKNFVNKGQKIVYVNEAFTKMTGYNRDEVIGKTPGFLQGVKSDKKELDRLSIAIQNWEPCEITIINYKKNGEEFWVNFSVNPVTDQKGWVTHWIAIERDVTETRKLDQAVTKAIINAQEEERFQIGGELHDNVNQILAAVLLNLGMTKGKSLALQNEWIDKSAEYIHLAIAEIRKLSHKLAPVSFEINTIKQTFDTLLKSININHQFKIKFTISEIDELEIDGDIQLNLYRILQEQVNNILKYSQADKIEVSIKLLNNCIYLRIYDNGIGFDPAVVKKGIGLNNIKKRTELFSGNFSINSTPGNGCEIIVEIPIPS